MAEKAENRAEKAESFMKAGMLMNGSHGAHRQWSPDRAMPQIMRAVAQALATVAWHGLAGEFDVVLKINDSRVTHVNASATVLGEAGRFDQDRFDRAMTMIDRVCRLSLERVPPKGFYGHAALMFTHTNGILAYTKTTFAHMSQIDG